MGLNGFEIATRHRAGERRIRPKFKGVSYRCLHKRSKRIKRNARARGEPLHLPQQRDDMI